MHGSLFWLQLVVAWPLILAIFVAVVGLGFWWWLR